MKNLFTNAILFVALCFVFSGLTACETAKTDSVNASKENTSTEAKKDSNPNGYPLAPSAILQTEIKMLDGTTFKIEDKKGKVVLLNLWATWCGPCRAEMPHLVEMQNKYRDKGFEVVGLNTDEESIADINDFAAKMKLNYAQGYSTSKLTAEFVKLSQMNGIPQSILIDRENRLTGVFGGGSPKVINSMKETVDKIVNQ
jgi:thiol-disulfide isomerase/thioredoxin